MRIGIVGNGVVGNATARCYMESHEVRVYDIVPEKRTHSLTEVLLSDLIFVCLPTPQKDGSLECDTAIVETFFKQVSETPLMGTIPDRANYVLRSTVPIGFTRQMREKYKLANMVHSPEFLTARTAILDAQLPARNIIGFPFQTIDASNIKTVIHHPINELYTKRFPHCRNMIMSSDESEAVKLFQNAHGAVTVALWNEFRELSDAKNLRWDTVRNAVLASGWITGTHTQVPGPDGKRGFGGSCLPKDLASLVHQLGCNSQDAAVTSAALQRNARDRKRTA